MAQSPMKKETSLYPPACSLLSLTPFSQVRVGRLVRDETF